MNTNMLEEDIDVCARCGSELKDGIAIEQTYTCGSLDFGMAVTYSAGGTGKIIPCRKCSECGWSVS